MTNKNKNIETLVKRATRTPVTQFEIIPTLTERVKVTGAGAETDEHTSDLDGAKAGLNARTIAELQQLVEERCSRVQELEYQLEHALSRRRGLQKELEVREEITDSVNEDVRKARAQLTEAANELESLHVRYQALQHAHAETDTLARELGEQVARHQSETDAKERELDELRDRLETARHELLDLRTYVDGRRRDWSRQAETIAELQSAIANLTRDRTSLAADLASTESELTTTRQELSETQAESLARQRALEQLSEENRELKEALEGDAEQVLARYREKVATQSGELAARAQSLENLRKDFDRLEEYANSLRIRVQDQASSDADLPATSPTNEDAPNAATATLKTLTDKLGRARTLVDTLSDEKERLKLDFDREVRQIRFDLERAQTTIADQEAINERLSSELADNQEFRQALEAHVGDQEQSSRTEIESLTSQLEDARAAAANFERKIRIKDGAISDLMKELADRSGSMPISLDLENALRKIDGYRPEAKKVRRKGERDYRVARMLIGEADGKELRFPLFKDRLTIGRTPHNDVQLNMRFISRRHAVIATDNNKTRIIDWGSRNGVYVNKKRITEKILESGDMITIGTTHLRFQERSKS